MRRPMIGARSKDACSNNHLPVSSTCFVYPRSSFSMRSFSRLLLLIAALTIVGCEQVDKPTASTPGNAAATTTGKIAITTSSEEARKEFLAGRDLAERLRITDSIAHFDKAISLDPNFALADL